MFSWYFGLYILPLFLPISALAAIVNVTVDDYYGDPTTGALISYSPSAIWNVGGVTCSSCTARPDTAQSYNGTWHDGTFNSLPGSNSMPNTVLNAQFNFTGTAVYVYCILAQSAESPTGTSDMIFTVDGVQLDFFHKMGVNGYPEFIYHFPVFSLDGLSQGSHSITIQSGEKNGNESLILLDYIVYSTEISSTPSASSDPESSSSSTPLPSTVSHIVKTDTTPKIIGGVIGGVLVICMIGIALLWCRRRRNNSHPNHAVATDPAPPVSSESPSSFFHSFFGRNREGARQAAKAFDPNLLVRRIVQSTPGLASSGRRKQKNQPRPRPILLDDCDVEPITTRQIHSAGVMGAMPSYRIASIEAWRAAGTTAPITEFPDLSEELSSYYDEHATESRYRVATPPLPPPPPQTYLPPKPRRLTVMNA